MANMLVETLAGDFDASEFEDDYAGAVEALVKAKIEGGEVKKTADLDQVLRRGRRPAGRAPAVGRGRQDRAGRGRPTDDDEAKPAKKAAAKKSTTKKTAAKKTHQEDRGEEDRQEGRS